MFYYLLYDWLPRLKIAAVDSVILAISYLVLVGTYLQNNINLLVSNNILCVMVTIESFPLPVTLPTY